MRETMQTRPTVLLTATWLLLAAPRAAATVAPDTTTTRGPRNPVEVEAFIDGWMSGQLPAKHVAGAEVVVVRDGQVLFLKGYGYRDLAKRLPVDPAKTLFRPGSVTKLFTWTAVMQLVEAGKLNLDADVNSYLDFKIPATFPQPITLRHIMTHSAGFEEDSRNLVGQEPSDIRPLGQWLVTQMPKRVRAPGTYSAYSNYATAVAGYIVERVSGESWEDYLERHILTPLGMSHTSPRQPLPASLAGDMSVGYKYVDGESVAQKFEILIGGVPAGALSTTASDMAPFMIAHLAHGAFGTVRILGDSISRMMQTQAMTADPRLPGFALGFYEQSSHGLRIIGHGGDTQWFHSNLFLIPSERLGVFVTMNTNEAGQLTEPFVDAFLDHYYPAPAPAVTVPAGLVAQAGQVAGEYLTNRHSYTTYQKALGLAGFGLSVTADTSGIITIHGGGETTRWVPVGPLLYREEFGSKLFAFKADSAGRIIRGFASANPTDAVERLTWYQSPSFHLSIDGVCLGLFVLTVVAAVGRWFRRRWGTPRTEDALPGRGWMVGAALAYLVFVITIVALAGDPIAALFGPATGLKRALVLPVLALALTLVAAIAAVRHWRSGAGTTAARLRYSTVVAAALVFAWSLNQWNLLGWRT